jgi:hypothetical protein
MKLAAAAASATIALGAPRLAHAYRPFDGTDADTAETGDIELEIGPLQGTLERRQLTYEPGFVFNYGFSPGFEFVIDADGDGIPLGASPSTARFVTDVQVKHVLRAGILQGASGPSVALETGPLLPTFGHQPQGVDGGWDVGLIVSYAWKPITVHLNFEGIYTRDREFTEWTSAILEGPRAWTVRPIAELLAQHDRLHGDVASALVGALWHVDDRFTFDLAGRVSNAQGAAALELRAGVTWTIGT